MASGGRGSKRRRGASGAGRSGPDATPIVLLLLWIAGAKVVLGIVLAPWTLGLPDSSLDAHAYPPTIHLLLTVVFAAGAAMLLFGGARDERAVLLGTFFLSIGAVYAERLLERGFQLRRLGLAHDKRRSVCTTCRSE